MTYKNPGKVFIEKHGDIESFQDILDYVEFLRIEAGIDKSIPVDLEKIFTHFNLPQPVARNLPGQQGLLVDADKGIIVVNSNDSISRQSFSLAHELIEILFSCLQWDKTLGGSRYNVRLSGFPINTKEFLCDWAAANLLMPKHYIGEITNRLGLNFFAARTISTTCHVSFIAAVIQLIKVNENNVSVICWKMKNKPSEEKLKNNYNQQTLFEMPQLPSPKKLRVDWAIGSKNADYIPKNKSVDPPSLIYKTWVTKETTSGIERLWLTGKKLNTYYIENSLYNHQSVESVLTIAQKTV
jgi:Zn-dependent peptidase ImmA (M78 family)